jgi:hypothetical protein
LPYLINHMVKADLSAAAAFDGPKEPSGPCPLAVALLP